MPRCFRPSLLALALLAALAGCASDGIETSVAFDPLTQFPARATFLWDDASIQMPEDDRITALGLPSVIKEAAEVEFAARGYTLSTDDSANYLMSFQVTSHSWIGADNSRAVGSLSLLLVEAASGRRVWLGIGRSEIVTGRSREERLASMRMALAKMLEKFPPNQSR